MAGALTPFPERAGAASSLFGFVQQSWSAIVGAAVGHLLGTNAWPMVAAIALMGLAALGVWAMTRGTRRNGGTRRAKAG
jgi:DHA1 family bicyclomycin/chloramphenicol resistance-like MFS transporter